MPNLSRSNKLGAIGWYHWNVVKTFTLRCIRPRSFDVLYSDVFIMKVMVTITCHDEVTRLGNVAPMERIVESRITPMPERLWNHFECTNKGRQRNTNAQ